MEKTVQIDYNSDKGCKITYFIGDEQVGEAKTFDEVPKRLEFFLEKFPKQDKPTPPKN